MSKKQKQKGYRTEYKLAKFLKKAGIESKRVPLSGQTEFAKGDLIVSIGGKEYVGEVKARKEGFKELYKFLHGKDLLFLKRDRHPFLVVMTVEKFIEIVGGDVREGDGR